MAQAEPKSSSGQEQQQTAQTVPYPSPKHFEDDTIDLYNLWITLWNRKWLVIAVTVAAGIVSIVYALQMTRTYKAEALLLPPNAQDVQLMSYFLSNKSGLVGSNITEYSAGFVYSRFKQNLSSRTLQKKFLHEKALIEALAPGRTTETRNEEIYQKFTKLIMIGEDGGITSLSIELHDAEMAAQWVNDLIEFTDKETVKMLVEDLQTSIANKIRNIKYEISSKREMAKKRHEDMITQYEEAAFIAQKLGVMDRVDSTNIVQNNQLNITTSNIPLYFRGYRSLKTELSFLKSRESLDPFIGGLRDLQEHLEMLKAIKFDKENMHAVNIDRAAYPPKSPNKPNRRLIVSLATVVGLFSGIFLAFFIEFVQNQRKKHSG